MALGGVFHQAENLHCLSQTHLVTQESTGWRGTLALQHPVNGCHLVGLVGETLPERQRFLGKLNPHSRARAGCLRDKRATGAIVHLGPVMQLGPATNPFYTVTLNRAGAEDSALLESRCRCRCRSRQRANARLTVARDKLVKVRGHRVRFARGFWGDIKKGLARLSIFSSVFPKTLRRIPCAYHP